MCLNIACYKVGMQIGEKLVFALFAVNKEFVILIKSKKLAGMTTFFCIL